MGDVDFRLDEGQVALQEAVAAFCSSRLPLDSIVAREGAPIAGETWLALADLGVFSLLVPEDQGGLGLGMVDAVVVFEQLGRSLVAGPTWWSTIVAPLVAGVADGSRVVGGVDLVADPGPPVLVEHAGELDVLVVLRDDGIAAIDRSDLVVSDPLDPLDPLTPVGRVDALPPGERIGDVVAAEVVRRQGTTLTAALLLGIAETALAVARDYSLEREQFGQPIGTFQALKHLMADMFVRSSLARSATYAAAALLDDPAVGDADRAVAAAKLLAGEAAVDNARASVQVLGGMGFTWEMPPNHLLKRAWVLEHTFGTSSSHAGSLALALAGELR